MANPRPAGVSYHIFFHNYDRLVRYDADTLEPVPGIPCRQLTEPEPVSGGWWEP